MPGKQIFIDTNILVYAYDLDAGEKHRRAFELIATLWQRAQRPGISVQVLQELYVALLRHHATAEQARVVVGRYFQWEVVPNDPDVLKVGMDAAARWQISLWDALILAAAQRAGAQLILSEDFSAGQRYDGIEVVNPLTRDVSAIVG